MLLALEAIHCVCAGLSSAQRRSVVSSHSSLCLALALCREKEYKSLSKPNQKNIEPEPGLVLNVSTWYKTKSNLDVHLSEPWTVQFVQVHFTTQKFRPGSAKIFFSGT